MKCGERLPLALKCLPLLEMASCIVATTVCYVYTKEMYYLCIQ